VLTDQHFECTEEDQSGSTLYVVSSAFSLKIGKIADIKSVFEKNESQRVLKFCVLKK